MKAAPFSLLLVFSSSRADPCPNGYTQAPNGGDCFKTISYYDSFMGRYNAHSVNDAETDCNNAAGGMLASIHSEEENDFALDVDFRCVPPGAPYSPDRLNFGLRCIGLDCKWDDGTPVTYTNFADQHEAPRDDGQTRCYMLETSSKWNSRYLQNGCGADQSHNYDQGMECWLCKVKAKTFECDANEHEYKGGCVSVHTSPLDQKNAEESCPGGGHLVSIHSGNENNFYKQLALDAGVTGTFYIGGQWSNGKFEWIDGTNQNTFIWASGFPNTIFGACSQMLLASEFGNAGQWTNVDCSAKLSYICFRDGREYGPTLFPPTPKADPKCPPIQYYTGAGSIYSPNYPLSIPSQQTCEYVIGEEDGTKASVKFTKFDSKSGSTLSFYDGLNTNEPFLTLTTPTINQSYTATTNVLKIVFSVSGESQGTGWEAEFSGMLAVPFSLLLLFSSVQANPCPDGYTQAPNGGDCYKGMYYYDSFDGIYYPRDTNYAETDCNRAGGGMLASFHSEEETAFAYDIRNTCYPKGRTSSGRLDFGLRCTGLVCKWDDGSPVTYTNFMDGHEPVDDGKTRCYKMEYTTQWQRRFSNSYDSCGIDPHLGDSVETGWECWLCSVKAKTLACNANESEYKGGCVSVHTSPLDQNNAEKSCPGGGHLVSIHSGDENDFYKQVALNAGVTGTFYIGGQWSNGVFGWIDDTNQNIFYWASGFPNTIFGACSQMLLASEFGNAGQWSNVDCSAKLPYICLRTGNNYGPTLFPPTPKANPKCPPIQYYTGAGSIYSPNYPLSIPSEQTCEYVIGEEEGTKASIKFTKFDCKSGASLSFFDGLNTNEPFLSLATPVINQSYAATSNALKIVFSVSGDSQGTGWEAEFSGVN